MERKTVLTAVVLLGLLCAAVAQAELYIPTSYGMGADTWIANCPAKPDWEVTDNFGGEGRMRLRYNGGGSRFFGVYLRFDISGMTEPFEEDTRLQMTTSWIKTYTSDKPARVFYIYGLADNDTDDNWVEGTGIEKTQVTDNSITYANAPGMVPTDPLNSGNFAIDPLKLTLLGTMKTLPQLANVAYPQYTFLSDPSSDLVNFLNSDGNGLVTFVLIEKDGTSGQNNETEFQTKENSLGFAPALVPEPATMMLLGLGSLLIARTKHR